MIINIDETTIAKIKNPSLRNYGEIYQNIQRAFLEQMGEVGLPIAPVGSINDVLKNIESQEKKGAVVRNHRKSLYLNRISPACTACRTGVDSKTYYISLKCSRQCFYCFNPNQEHYDYFQEHCRDCVEELKKAKEQGEKLKYIALSGGEPLLHTQETISFFKAAKEYFPRAHKRLYTSGDFASREVLKALGESGLEEIRFSIRLHEGVEARNRVFKKIALAQEYIPAVMVEMPVFPGSYTTMIEILTELEKLEAFGINLLEFCFPYQNPKTFSELGFRLKNPPFRVLYNYWYAGGLPIDESENECLQLVDFAREEGFKLGVHYCSLENKHSGQIYQQNYGRRLPKTAYFSPRDYYLKSAKVFGDDIKPVEKKLRKAGYYDYSQNKEYDFLEFHVSKIPLLKGLGVEIGLSTCVMEDREDGEYLRELKLDLVYPEKFSMEEI